MTPRHRLTASNLARYFKHNCDRLFRWEAVGGNGRASVRAQEGIPDTHRNDSRPGIQLLMAEGDAFEMEQVVALAALHGADQVHVEGIEKKKGQDAPKPTPLARLVELLLQDVPPRFVAQPAFDLWADAHPAAESFLRSVGLDPAQVELRPAFFDLLEVLPANEPGGLRRLRVWDFKASPQARHEHFAQVAYYSLLLEHALPVLGLDHAYAVDTQTGTVQSKQEAREDFDLEPYRQAVTDVLAKRIPTLLATPAPEAHYHVCAKCLVCEYVGTCEQQATEDDDLSRIPYISSESKRRLVEAGISTCAALAALTDVSDGEVAPSLKDHPLRALGHDLSVHLARYVLAARALGRAEAVTLDATTLAVPGREDVRVVLSAEQDAVTGTVFALGLKVFEGWDDDTRTVIGQEAAWVAEEEGPEEEARILTALLRDLNALFERIDAGNKVINDTSSPASTAYHEARERADTLEAAYKQAQADLDAFRSHPDHKGASKASKKPHVMAIVAERSRLEAVVAAAKAPKDEAAEAVKELWDAHDDDRWKRRLSQRSLHVYLYDGLDLAALTGALERHVGEDAGPDLRRAVVKLIRLFPPSSVLPDAETFRSVPGTIVADALRRLVALPAPFLYDLKTVSAHYRPHNADGEESGSRFLPSGVFCWPHSNQVAFERIHDVWRWAEKHGDAPFVHRTRDKDHNPIEVLYTRDSMLDKIRETVLGKLRATDSVVRRLKQDHLAARRADQAERGVEWEHARGTLLLRKGPFRLFTDFDPTDLTDPDALQAFALLEAALGELQTRALHTLKPDERAARFEAIEGLQYMPGLDEDEKTISRGPNKGVTFFQALWFTFDPSSLDAKFQNGQEHLVVTPEKEPDTLLRSVDGKLFAETVGYQGQNYKVAIDRFDLSDPEAPRVLLRPQVPEAFRAALQLDAQPTRRHVLDSPHTDWTTRRLLSSLEWLRVPPDGSPPDPNGDHARALLESGAADGWKPTITSPQRHEAELRRRMTAAGKANDLNDEQWDILRGVPQDPLALVWGPPGTGKTHVAGHLLALYALAASSDRPLRVYVTAATHHAAVNVLAKLAELAETYGIDPDHLRIAKLGKKPNAADVEFGLGPKPDVGEDACFGRVSRLNEDALVSTLAHDPAPCLVVGGTVYALHKALEAGGAFAGQPLFDLVLIDEASQMTVPQALIPFSAAKPSGTVVLAGDDKQLPPIVHGSYPEDYEHLLSSVFAFARHRALERLQKTDESAHASALAGGTLPTLFQLTRNFRMNEPLTAHPRASIYGTYASHSPDLRSTLEPTVAYDASALVPFVLHPDRPAVLVRYTPPTSFTASNPLEADLAAALVDALSRSLVDPKTGALYTPQDFASRGAAVLAPHRAQNATVRKALAAAGFATLERPLPLVDTVEKLQGKEREAIIVSYGVADGEYATAEADFLLSQARFNVASTRAQRKLVVLCSDPVLDAVPQDRKTLSEAAMLKGFRVYCSDGQRTIPFAWSAADGTRHTVELHVHWRTFDAVEGDGAPADAAPVGL